MSNRRAERGAERRIWGWITATGRRYTVFARLADGHPWNDLFRGLTLITARSVIRKDGDFVHDDRRECRITNLEERGGPLEAGEGKRRGGKGGVKNPRLCG